MSDAVLRELAEQVAQMQRRIAALSVIEAKLTSASISDATSAATANMIAKRDASAGAAFALVTSTGIVFPATQVASAGANTLDDYEEGTWTPSMAFEASQVGSFTYTTQYGEYVKIGRYVNAVFRLAWSAKPSAGLAWQILGYPYAAASANSLLGVVTATQGITFTARTGGAGGTMISVLGTTTTVANPYVFGSGTAFGDGRLDVSALATSGLIYGTINYLTA